MTPVTRNRVRAVLGLTGLSVVLALALTGVAMRVGLWNRVNPQRYADRSTHQLEVKLSLSPSQRQAIHQRLLAHRMAINQSDRSELSAWKALFAALPQETSPDQEKRRNDIQDILENRDRIRLETVQFIQSLLTSEQQAAYGRLMVDGIEQFLQKLDQAER